MQAMSLPHAVGFALERLQSAGVTAYLVGGCVRDHLRGVTPHDYDIATEAMPQEVLRIFLDCRTFSTGLQHGTVTVLAEGVPIEITTFRVDGDYHDARHPDRVTFTRSFREDAARRDFTVNAMGYSPLEGVVDFYGGQKDLENKIIRTVGDAELRFREDALRILRALRFSSVLDFEIEAQTARAAIELAPSLRMVSVERIYEELCKLLCGPRVFRVCTELRAVLAAVVPELADCFDLDQKNPHHVYDVYTHILHTVEAVAPDKILRLAAFFHDIGKPRCRSVDDQGIGHFYGHASVSADMAEKILLSLHAERETICAVKELVKHHGDPLPCDNYGLRKMISRKGEKYLFRMLALKRADTAALSASCRARLAEYDRIEERARTLLQEAPCFSARDLAIGGEDIMALGVPKGPTVGEVLTHLLDLVMAENLKNEREALLLESKRFFAEKNGGASPKKPARY